VHRAGQHTTDRVPSALLASASKASEKQATQATKHAAQWQIDSLAYYDQLGVVRYASDFRARAFPKIRWYVGEIDDQGEVKETTNEVALDAWERVQDPGGGRSVLLETYARLRFLNGEKYLTWQQPTRNEAEQWEILSVLELRQTSNRRGRATYRRLRAPGLTPEELVEAADDDFEPVGKDVLVYRLWRRHPAYSMMADAPMRSVLAECEEMVRATQTINARLISRLSGPGILAIPESWSKLAGATANAEGELVAPEDPNLDVFMRELADAMMAAISNPGSADSVVPIIIRVPDGSTDGAHLYKIWEPNEVIRELELRDKAIHRFSIGVDMPSEKVEGLGGTNHWNAFAIDKDSWGHIDPDAQAFADDMASVYLRPYLRGKDVENWSRFVIAYDPSELLTNPDGFKDAMELYNARAVGKAYLREAAGDANDEDEPTDEELAEMLFVQTRQQVEVVDGVIQEGEEPEPFPGEEEPVGEEELPGMPPEPEEDESGLNAAAHRVLGAAESELERIRDRAGAKIRSYVQSSCPECVAAIKPVPNGQVAATLGAAQLAEIGAPTASRLVEDTALSFVSTLERRWGVSHAQAEALGEIMQIHAGKTLYDEAPPALPIGFTGRVKALHL